MDSEIMKKIRDPRPICQAFINKDDGACVVYARLIDEDAPQRLFSYYPEEITLAADELIGRTVREAFQLKLARDRARLEHY